LLKSSNYVFFEFNFATSCRQALHAQLESDSVQIAASKAAMDAAREAMQAEVQAIRDEMTEVRLQADDQVHFQ
jgi:uncharacterized protein YhaN